MAASCHRTSRTPQARGRPIAKVRWRIGALDIEKRGGGTWHTQIGSRSEGRGDFGGSGAGPLRGREIIGKGLVDVECAALVSGFKPSRRRQLEGGGAPRIAGRRHR